MATVAGYQSGVNCALYYDAAGVGGSSWAEWTDVANVDTNSTRNEGVVKNRASSYELSLPGQIGLELTITSQVNRGNAGLSAFKAAYDAGTVIGVAAMSGIITDINEFGYQFDALVTSFNRTEGVDDAVEVTMTLKPHANGSTAPSHATITV